MEKLLKLLNEYNCEKLGYIDKWKSENNKFILDYIIGTYSFRTHLYIISKEYGFIQWLIKNDKIDRVKEVINDIEYYGHGQIENVDTYDQYQSLLMLLAINDDPIEFLVSILK